MAKISLHVEIDSTIFHAVKRKAKADKLTMKSIVESAFKAYLNEQEDAKAIKIKSLLSEVENLIKEPEK